MPGGRLKPLYPDIPAMFNGVYKGDKFNRTFSSFFNQAYNTETYNKIAIAHPRLEGVKTTNKQYFTVKIFAQIGSAPEELMISQSLSEIFPERLSYTCPIDNVSHNCEDSMAAHKHASPLTIATKPRRLGANTIAAQDSSASIEAKSQLASYDNSNSVSARARPEFDQNVFLVSAASDVFKSCPVLTVEEASKNNEINLDLKNKFR